MGPTSSIALCQVKLTVAECHEMLGALAQESALTCRRDSDHMTSLQDIQDFLKERTDVFLTHDWGIDHGVDNHQRVSRVNDCLKSKGLRTWFDEEKMKGNVRKMMIAGIENTSCVLVFVTKRYIEKVGGENTEDNCQLEFNFACRRKTAKRMLAVVMEDRVRDANKWTGEVGFALGGSIYVDLSAETDFESRMAELHQRILQLIGSPIAAVMEDPRWKPLVEKKIQQLPSLELLGSAPSSAPTPAAPTVAVSGGDEVEGAQLAELKHWFVQEIQLSEATAAKYARCLLEHDIGGIQRLARRLKKDRDLLKKWNVFSDEDIEDVLVALKIVNGDGAGESKTDPRPLEHLRMVADLLGKLDLAADATRGDHSTLQLLSELQALPRVPNVNAWHVCRRAEWSGTAAPERRYTALSLAALGGHRWFVSLLLQHPEIDVNQRNEDSSTALSCAGDAQIREWIEQRGGVVDPVESVLQTLDLVACCRDGDCAVLDALHAMQAIDRIYTVNGRTAYQHGTWRESMGVPPLLIACVNNHVAVVSRLLEHPGLLVNATDDTEEGTSLLYASAYGHEAVVDVLLRDPRLQPHLCNKYGDCALQLAVQRSEEGVAVRLAQDVRVRVRVLDQHQRTPLITAAQKGLARAVDALLARDPDGLGARDNMGRTALGYAAMSGHVSITERLLSAAGVAREDVQEALELAVAAKAAEAVACLVRHPLVDVNRPGQGGNSFLHEACEADAVDCVAALLGRASLQPNAQNEAGVTPLMLACANHCVGAVQRLLDDPRTLLSPVDKEGKSAAMWAREKGYTDVLELLDTMRPSSDQHSTTS